jgi:hypothetical protein
MSLRSHWSAPLHSGNPPAGDHGTTNSDQVPDARASARWLRAYTADATAGHDVSMQ